MYKAFVSSTYIDLKDHRQHVIRALRHAGFQVDPMEDWTADVDEPKVFSRERMAGCDLCILLVAFRRGHVPEGEIESITQLEYRAAREAGIDVLPFLFDDDANWRPRLDESQRDMLLGPWRSEIKLHYGVGFFDHSPESVDIAPALTRWVARRRGSESSAGAQSPTPIYWVGRPASLGDWFIGREANLAALSSAFSLSRAVVISGGAGTGKSRLAAEYTYRSHFSGFWTSAGATEAQTLAALAGPLGISTQDSSNGVVRERTDEELAPVVQKQLNGLPPTTLWVVDNLGDVFDVNEIAGFASSIRLLVTTRDSRNQMVPRSIGVIPLDVLGHEEAVKLLCSRSGADPSVPAVGAIVEIVGRLPLALEMLAVRLGEANQQPEKLLAELQRAPTPIQFEVFQRTSGTTIRRADSVFTAIVGTLESLPADFREPLSYLGYVSSASIPLRLVAELTSLNETDLDNMLEACRRQSVLSYADDQVFIHPLTIAAIAATNRADALETALSRLKL